MDDNRTDQPVGVPEGGDPFAGIEMPQPFKKRLDPRLRLLVILVVVVVAALLLLPLLNPLLPPEEAGTQLAATDIPSATLLLYATVQHETGVPWVTLMAIDRAQERVADLEQIRATAKILIDHGLLERGFTIAPIATAAQIAGLYSNNQKVIFSIAKQSLLLDEAYTLISRGRAPSSSGAFVPTAQGVDIQQCGEAMAAFSGQVSHLDEQLLEIACDNGWRLRYRGVQQAAVQAGERVYAGQVLGQAQTLTLECWLGDRWIDPLPFLWLWLK